MSSDVNDDTVALLKLQASSAKDVIESLHEQLEAKDLVILSLRTAIRKANIRAEKDVEEFKLLNNELVEKYNNSQKRVAILTNREFLPSDCYQVNKPDSSVSKAVYDMHAKRGWSYGDKPD